MRMCYPHEAEYLSIGRHKSFPLVAIKSPNKVQPRWSVVGGHHDSDCLQPARLQTANSQQSKQPAGHACVKKHMHACVECARGRSGHVRALNRPLDPLLPSSSGTPRAVPREPWNARGTQRGVSKVMPQRRVEVIDEGDVGCNGKSKKKKAKPAGGTGFGQTDEAAPAVAPAEVHGRIDEDYVDCNGKSKRRPKHGAVQSAGDMAQDADADADAPQEPDALIPGTLLPKPDIDYPSEPVEQMYNNGAECGMCAPPPCCYNKKVGRMYVCCETSNSAGEPKIVCGWPACWAMHLFTQALIWGVAGLVFWASFPQHAPWVWVSGSSLLLLTSFSLFRTGTGDPGILPIYRTNTGDAPTGPEPEDARWTSYHKAGSNAWVKVPDGMRTTWCSESLVLVHGYDHFCPWTGNTIAGGNLKCFHTFIASLCTLCVFVGVCGISALGVAERSLRDSDNDTTPG